MQNDIHFLKCTLCDYKTKRILELKNHIKTEHPNSEENIPFMKRSENTVAAGSSETYSCKKCKKIYKTKRHLINHEEKCVGINILTCPKCLMTFSSRGSKSRHIKAGKCKSNSFNETLNYFKSVDQKTMDTINAIFEANDDDGSKNVCHVLEGDEWKEKELDAISANNDDGTDALLMRCDDNKLKLLNDIQDSDKYENIRNKFVVIYNKSDNDMYNHVLGKIMELIKNT